MEKIISTPHINTTEKNTSSIVINTTENNIAPTMIMVGDPARAKYYANKLLKNPKLVCNIRLINMWTGTYNGNLVTISAHGMGFSSMGIYAHELFETFKVKRIIRLGTCLTYKKEINIGDVLIGNKYYTYSHYGEGYGIDPTKASLANPNLLEIIEKQFKKNKVNYHIGALYSSEWFYAPTFKMQGVKPGSLIETKIDSGEIIGKEMESYVLQLIANYFNCEAITLATVLKNWPLNIRDPKVDVLPMAINVLEALFGPEEK